MILRRLHYFATVAKEGGISRAASRLLIAQPALSRQMHELERAVELSLFDRDARGVTLTPAGVRLRDDVERIFARLSDALRRARLAHEGKIATLRLGLSRGALTSRRIGRLIAAFHEHYPDVELVVTEVSVTAQAQALKAGEVDSAIALGLDDDSALVGRTLFEQRVDSVMLAASHPLAQDGVVEPHELHPMTLRLDSETLPRFPTLRQNLEQLGFEWKEVEGVDTVFSYVAAGDGWTTAPSSQFMTPPPGFVVRPLRGLDVMLPMRLWWRKSDDLPALRNLLSIAEGVMSAADESQWLSDAVKRPSSVSDRADNTRTAAALKLHQLVALATSLNEGSLSAAAERLSLTQSAISRQIRGLERTVGVPLVARTAGRLVATSAGEVLRTEAMAILELVGSALEHAKRTVNGVTGRCAIGTMPRELTNGLLVGALKQVTGRYPNVTITVVEGRYQEALLSRDIDLAILALFPGALDDQSVSSMLLYDDPLECALLPASHPMANQETLSVADLREETFLIVSQAFSPVAYDLIVREVRRLGLGANVRAEYNGARTIWAAVASGEGWGIGPRSLRHAAPEGTVARRVEGLSIPWSVSLNWRREDTDPIVRQVADIFIAQAGATS